MFLWQLGQMNANFDDVILKSKNNLNTSYKIRLWKYIPNIVSICSLKLGNYTIVPKY